MSRAHRLAIPSLLLCLASWCVPVVHAGVVNPDISVVGQPVASWTNDADRTAEYRRVTFGVGETELVLDAALNPYARGFVNVSIADGQANIEEAYFTLLRGLPAGLELKGGRYRVGFGKLNAAHPHTYPFIERFHVLAKLLPGADAFEEDGVDVSGRLPAPGDIALTASADVLQGDSFHANDPTQVNGPNGAVAGRAREAVLGRLSAFVPIGDRSGLELGASATQGTNSAVVHTLTTAYGADAKLKYWWSDQANTVVQAEWLGEHRVQHEVVGGPELRVDPNGGYVFVNTSWSQRYNAGVSYERSRSVLDHGCDQSLGVFAGLALMEETTWFRLALEHTIPARLDHGTAQGPTTDTVRLGIVYSMGPHKAHQF